MTPPADSSISARFLLRRPARGGTPFTLDADLVLPGTGLSAVFGHSGSGKTTLLRCIAGLERADEGALRVRGQTWQDGRSSLPVHRRPIGYVFQEASLFPHLTVLGNLRYALKRADVPVPPGELQHVLDALGLEALLQRRPEQLSGGERQRVAIARALLVQPQLLLMDEPLASLDEARKQEILPYLERLPAEFELPVIYVSHSMAEVARLADYAVLLNSGSVAAQGPAAQVFSRIDLPLGLGEEAGAILEARVVERDRDWHLTRVAFSGGELWLREGGDEPGQAVRVRVLARDVSLALQCHDDSSILNRIAVEVVEVDADPQGSMALLRLRAGSDHLVARITRRSLHQLQLRVGSRAWAQIKSVALVR